MVRNVLKKVKEAQTDDDMAPATAAPKPKGGRKRKAADNDEDEAGVAANKKSAKKPRGKKVKEEVSAGQRPPKLY